MPDSKKNESKERTKTSKNKNVKKRKENNNSEQEELKNKKNKRTKNGKKTKWSERHPKLSIILKIFIVLFLLMCVVGAGIVAAIFFGLFGDDFKISKDELIIGVANSVVVDQNG